MDFEVLNKYLLEAQGKDRQRLDVNNPYQRIGFDREKNRLGWVRTIAFEQMKKYLEDLESILKNKKQFVFVGMGGSINGIKTLIPLFKKENYLYTLDMLDPLILEELLKKIDIKKTLILPISKSGTTKETQLLAFTLKKLFGKGWQSHFLWLTDPTSFDKLNALGWEGVKKISIQFDNQTDIVGRFSCPHTLIFFLPLFLLLNKDFKKLECIYHTYLSFQEEVKKHAFYFANEYKDKECVYFQPIIEGVPKDEFFLWVTQLLQESLGSKKEDFSVKTIPPEVERRNLFLSLYLDLKIENPPVLLMLEMFFFQLFVAYFAAFKEINFVTQDFVEEYKRTMRELKKESLQGLSILELGEVVKKVKENIKDNHRFIEIVLYFYPWQEIVRKIKEIFKKTFPQKAVLVFEGSNWNHASYQSAYMDKDTFYLLLLRKNYKIGIPYLGDLEENVYTLKLISKATQLSLPDKSFLCTLSI